MDVKFYSEADACCIEPHDNHAIISISQDLRKVPLKSDWKHLLRLNFNDLDWDQCFHMWYVHFQEEGDFDKVYEDRVFFDNEHATRIIVFLKQLPSNVKCLHVHCTAGTSRSSAVAHWFASKPGNSMETFRASNPNAWVMKVLYRTELLIKDGNKYDFF